MITTIPIKTVTPAGVPARKRVRNNPIVAKGMFTMMRSSLLFISRGSRGDAIIISRMSPSGPSIDQDAYVMVAHEKLIPGQVFI
jgi:hypothetical protein